MILAQSITRVPVNWGEGCASRTGTWGNFLERSERSEPFCQVIGKGSRHANWPGAETCLAALEADLLAEAANHDGSHWILSSLARHHPRCLFVFLCQNI